MLPMVRKMAWPVAGAVHRYQTELLAGLTESPWDGSSGSAVAPMVRPVTDLLALGRNCAPARLSFAGESAAELRAPGALCPFATWGHWAAAGGWGSASAGAIPAMPSENTAATARGILMSFMTLSFWV